MNVHIYAETRKFIHNIYTKNMHTAYMHAHTPLDRKNKCPHMGKYGCASKAVLQQHDYLF